MRFIYNGHANEGGVYRITNQTNGRIYIGSTCQFKVRWATHRRELLKGNHCNAFLQNDFNKCGADTFVVEVLEVIRDRDFRLRAEGAMIRQHFGEGCYNLEPEVGPHYPVNSRPRKPHTEATKEKIRQAKLGKKLPSEVEAQRVDAIRAAHATRKASGAVRISPLRGVPRTEEAKAKMRESIEKRRQNGTLVLSQEQKEHLRRVNLGKVCGPRSEETREKLKKAWESRSRVATRGPMSEATKEKIRQAKLGKSHTETARAKMSASHKGRPLSDATKAKMSATRTGLGAGRTVSEEARAKMSAAKKGRPGRPLSEDTKAKISAARKLRAYVRPSDETRAKMSAAQKLRRTSEKLENLA